MDQDWLGLGTHLFPCIVINGLVFRGQLNPDNVFEAICASFTISPNSCRSWMREQGIPFKEEDGVTNK
jgi:hypothetical protein